MKSNIPVMKTNIPNFQNSLNKLNIIYSSEKKQIIIYVVSNKDKLTSKISKTHYHPIDEHISACKSLEQEYKQLKQLKHPNIIKAHDYKIVKEESQKMMFCSIILDKYEQDMFQFLKKSFPNILSLNKVAQMFRPVVEALNFMHQIGKTIGHFDIKPENLLLDKNENLILADFGHSYNYSLNKLSSTYKIWKQRAMDYLAPEICSFILQLQKTKDKSLQEDLIKNADESFQYEKFDVFSLGVTIFSCVFYNQPFKQGYASKNDKIYQYIFNKQSQMFWKSNSQFNEIIQQLGEMKSQQFINLIEQMLAYNPNERLSFQQILNHDFFNQK